MRILDGCRRTVRQHRNHSNNCASKDVTAALVRRSALKKKGRVLGNKGHEVLVNQICTKFENSAEEEEKERREEKKRGEIGCLQ